MNALDKALRQAIGSHYPELEEIHLSNYKVRILDEHRATAATTRVLIVPRMASASEAPSEWARTLSKRPGRRSWTALSTA